MGFSGLMGFMGGAARAGEQVADQTLTRMDAAGVAQAKEEAQLRLEQRTEQAAIAREGRTNSREDFTYKRGLMDDKTKTADALQARLTEEARLQNPEYIDKALAAKNRGYAGDQSAQDKLAIDKQQAGSPLAVAKLKEEGEDRRLKIKTEAEKNSPKDSLPERKFLADRVEKATRKFFVLSGGTVNEMTGAMDAQAIKDRTVLARGQTAVATLVLQGEQEDRAAEIVYTKSADQQNAIIKSADEAQQKKAAEMANRTFMDRITGNNKEGRPLDEKPATLNAPKQEGTKSPAVIPDKTALKGGEEANGYVWDAKLGRAVPVKPMASTPAAPIKQRGLMPEAGAATMPQSTPEAGNLSARAAAAKQRMNELAKNTNYTSREERDAARNQKSVPQKSELAPGSTPEPTSTTSNLAPIGLTSTGAKVEAEYQALLNKDVPAIEFAKSLGRLLNDPEFRNNHPDLVKRYKIYQSEAAGEVNKGSR